MKRTLLLYTSKLFIGIAAFMILTASGCSYVSDYIEAQLTDRASFSIQAVYNAGSDTITISWNESGGTNFAGFEIYMTEDPNDEYAGYTIIGSQWAWGTISSDTFYAQGTSPSLSSSTADSYTVSTTQLNAIRAATDMGPGNYFFRVGIMDWDQNSEDRDADHGYTGSTYTDYLSHTEFDQISGYAMVYIP